jgi:hypothetical protein
MKGRWQTFVIVAMAAMMVGYMIGRGQIFPEARAQTSSTGMRVAVGVGQPVRDELPVIVVDPLEQTVLVYEYTIDNRHMSLEAARTYRYDKLLQQYQNGNGPSVWDVRRELSR